MRLWAAERTFLPPNCSIIRTIVVCALFVVAFAWVQKPETILADDHGRNWVGNSRIREFGLHCVNKIDDFVCDCGTSGLSRFGSDIPKRRRSDCKGVYRRYCNNFDLTGNGGSKSVIIGAKVCRSLGEVSVLVGRWSISVHTSDDEFNYWSPSSVTAQVVGRLQEIERIESAFKEWFNPVIESDCSLFNRGRLCKDLFGLVPQFISTGVNREVIRTRSNNYDLALMDQFAAKPGIGAADLAVHSDHDTIRSYDRDAHSRIQMPRTAKKTKRTQNPKYVRMLTNSGAFSADTSSGALIFDSREIDIDISHDGKRWHHFFGKKCFHNKPPFGLEAPNEGDLAPVEKSDNPNFGLEN
jgi:hypothetical protein